jgi:hypothetical protein
LREASEESTRGEEGMKAKSLTEWNKQVVHESNFDGIAFDARQFVKKEDDLKLVLASDVARIRRTIDRRLRKERLGFVTISDEDKAFLVSLKALLVEEAK